MTFFFFLYRQNLGGLKFGNGKEDCRDINQSRDILC